MRNLRERSHSLRFKLYYLCFQACPAPGTAEYKLVCPGGRGFQPNEETVILEDIDECGAMDR